MRSKDREHRSLVVVGQVEEAVPGHHSVDLAPERQVTHVGHDPFRPRVTLLAFRDQRGRRINADHCKSAIQQVASKRLAGAATQVQHRASRGQMRRESLDPCSLKNEFSTAGAIPGLRVALVQSNDLIGLCGHVTSCVSPAQKQNAQRGPGVFRF